MKKAMHYHLIACEVAFLEPKNEAIGALKINVLMRTTDRNFTSADLGKSQQVAQLQFFEKLANAELEVKDVFFIGISYLGLMTEEKFQEAPEGTKLQERSTAFVPDTNAEDPFKP